MPPVIVAAAVIEREGRVLLTRRMKGSHLAGTWEFPGGKLEDGEGPAAAVVRECMEECGIAIEARDVLDVTFHRYAEKDVLLLFYDCALVGGEVTHLGVADHVWCTPDEIDRYPLPPADVGVVEKLKRRARERGA
jgi:8-oxo-dGTP diphosphatase